MLSSFKTATLGIFLSIHFVQNCADKERVSYCV